MTITSAGSDRPAVTGRLPVRVSRLAQPFAALAMAVLAELGIALFVLNVVAIPLVAVWVGIPMLLAFVPAVRGFANLHRSLAGSVSGDRKSTRLNSSHVAIS